MVAIAALGNSSSVLCSYIFFLMSVSMPISLRDSLFSCVGVGVLVQVQVLKKKFYQKTKIDINLIIYVYYYIIYIYIIN